MVKLLENEKGNSIYGLIEYQKKMKMEKIQKFTGKVYSIFGFKTAKQNISEEDRKALESNIDAQKIMKRYFSEEKFDEEEGDGL